MTTGHPLAPYTTDIQRLWTVAHDNAQRIVGGRAIFQFQQPVIQKALVANAILDLLYLQADETPAERIRELLNQLIEANNAMHAEFGI